MRAGLESESESTRELGPLTGEHPLLGRVVEQRYRVLSHIGSGGMADVYEVEHVALGRHLAMKVLRQTRSSNPQLVRRFNREARAASRIESEHVVGISDYGALPEGQPFFVMELLRGQNLRQLLSVHAPLTVVRAVNIAIDVCLGLHAAHTSGLIHRDLKPENLWLSRADDGREVCVLLDFGVARFDGAHTTGDGVLVGTARYMSPEQIGSERPPGPASDLFSLGVILYESLTTTPPFAADSLERTLFRILNESPPPASAVSPDVPQELSAVIARAMAKEPAARYASALELAAALRPFAGAARPLPTLDAAGHSVLSGDTLAEADQALAGLPRTASASPARAAHPPSPRRAPGWLIGFGAGLLLGGAVFFWLRQRVVEDALGSARGTSQLAVSEPAADVLARDAAASAPPPGATTTSRPALATSAALVAATASAARAAPPRSQSHPTPAPSSRASRPEPPRPSFDGRNPYLQ